ncbi:hypothetical protein, partial [Knoellia sinensis]|uniref:hypothetical protein n=1 Tax=Knoellia sinensis TaxID=136100 RepID=UPI0005653510
MTIKAVHIPYGTSPISEVQVNERNATSYYPYVNSGPVEGGRLTIGGVDVVCYVNSHYPQWGEERLNPRASQLFDLAGVGMTGGAILGDALLVLAGDDYDMSTPSDFITHIVNSGATKFSTRPRARQGPPSERRKDYLAEYLKTQTATVLAEWDAGAADPEQYESRGVVGF